MEDICEWGGGALVSETYDLNVEGEMAGIGRNALAAEDLASGGARLAGPVSIRCGRGCEGDVESCVSEMMVFVLLGYSKARGSGGDGDRELLIWRSGSIRSRIVGGPVSTM